MDGTLHGTTHGHVLDRVVQSRQSQQSAAHRNRYHYEGSQVGGRLPGICTPCRYPAIIGICNDVIFIELGSLEPTPDDPYVEVSFTYRQVVLRREADFIVDDHDDTR